MPAPTDAVQETLFLSGFLFLTSAALAARQIYNRMTRGEVEPSEVDYYRLQDRRRALVSVVLGTISGLLAFSTSINILGGTAQARLWAWIMLIVLVLALGLLVLALLDWRANRLHVVRQGRALVEEHRALIAEAIKRHRESNPCSREPNGPGPSAGASG
jgi:hypothetical protein